MSLDDVMRETWAASACRPRYQPDLCAIAERLLGESLAGFGRSTCTARSIRGR